MNSRRKLALAFGAGALAVPIWSFAQQPVNIRRIGFLSSSTPRAYDHLLKEFRMGLTSLGYAEGRDIVIDVRWAENQIERLPALAAELLALGPTVIVTHGSPGVAASQNATSTVPIVFASAGDPVGQGFLQSYRRPGGNITGVAFNEEINKKLYEVVKGVLPAATRIATLVNPKNPAQKHHLDDLQMLSKALHFQSILVHATKEEEIETAFKQAVAAKAQAVVVPPLAPFIGLRDHVAELQNKYRVPTFHGMREVVQAGGIASYSFPFEENFRRAAAQVDKILKGMSPAEIPVELPMKYEIAVNLKAAKALNITVPTTFLLRAHLVIE
ncbi:MAG: ABC transporter substrate-binding protein [Burkholderiales bacterium]|nr:ABC transporter substrate-binding protein [Burkholderiales bacterium]